MMVSDSGVKLINFYQLYFLDMHSTPLKKSNDVSIKKQSRIGKLQFIWILF